MRPQAIQFLSGAGTFGPVILIPVILADDFGASNTVIGVIVGAFAAAGLLANYAFGRASDIYGRRAVLLVGLYLSGIVTLLQVTTLWSDSILMFATVRVLLGFCAGIFPSALLAYAYEIKTKMGRFSAWGAAGWGIGNLSVGFFGILYEWAFLYCSVILFVSFGIALTLPFRKEKRIAVPRFPKKLIKRNAPIYLSMLVRHTGANMIWVTYPLFLMTIAADETLVGVIYAINAFSQFTIMNFIDRYEPSMLVAFGLAASAVTFLVFSMMGSYWEIIPAQVLLASSWACMYVGSLRYVMDKNEEKATATGILASTMSISGILGPILGGLAATVTGFRGAMVIASLLAAVGLALFFYEMKAAGELYRLRTSSRRIP